ncbi:beta/gamma crystallin-related protein [Brevundimonas sp.]|uniref:beta/gamma crystallin-related protein n=1 Tax=Brevundimonas sp. TaxID=1871086 RepID=UPI002EDB716A
MLIETLAAMTMMSGPLQEAAPYGGGQERVAPRGDYRDTCSGEYVNRGRLYADCRDRRGNIRGTSIELNRCSDYEIRNDNGLLACGPHRGTWEDRPGGGGDGGWGGGRGSITVYRDSNFRGASTRFQGAVPNLQNSGFNDAISSMEFRGEWVACTDAYFRGQCQTFRDDVANLQRWGMNDRISSLRPVGRGGRG